MQKVMNSAKLGVTKNALVGCYLALVVTMTAACGGSTTSDTGEAGADAGASMISCTYQPMVGTGTFCNYDFGPPSVIAKIASLKDSCTGGPDGKSATYAATPCPSAGLLGCCVQTNNSDAGAVSIGSCYYTASTLPDPDASAAACEEQCHPSPASPTLKWTTTASP
jgi:hypothetical protein